MRWSYKTVHFSMKKDGLLGGAFLDESEIESTLNDYGKAGWELISFTEVSDGLIAVFKQPFSRGIPNLEEYDEQEEESEVETEAVETVTPVVKSAFSGTLENEEESEPENVEEESATDDSDVGSIRIN
ncbi:MAG TPA: DUF4177 domain-containing protein [Desulfocapsa sulfexigens]|nr:DUF4177 domain-containing protein [Desulfocapsa sulfexigens]